MKKQTYNDSLVDFINEIDSINTNDIFADDTTEIYRIVQVVETMPAYDRNILYLYALRGTYAAVAKELGICTSLAFRRIKQIKQYILSHL